ncbi:MAG: hypothetical protein C4348_00585 [Patescibacteria group bacterium]
MLKLILKNFFKMKSCKKIIFLSFLVANLLGSTSWASTLYLESRNNYIAGEDIVVDVYIDTEGNSINALETEIALPKDLNFKDYFIGDSIISFWLEKPYLERRSENIGDIVKFSGIIPGGYIGKRGKLASIILSSPNEVKNEKQIIIEFLSNSKTLLNDGYGTQDKLNFKNLKIKIIPGIGKTFYEVKDNFPPEEFKPEIVNIDGINYLIFEAKDKQSGISHYEVAEKPGRFFVLKPKISEQDFQIVESPYLIKDQTLRSFIFVKAIDRAGNERIEYLTPKNLFVGDEIIFIIIFAIILFIVFKKLIFP